MTWRVFSSPRSARRAVSPVSPCLPSAHGAAWAGNQFRRCWMSRIPSALFSGCGHSRALRGGCRLFCQAGGIPADGSRVPGHFLPVSWLPAANAGVPQARFPSSLRAKLPPLPAAALGLFPLVRHLLAAGIGARLLRFGLPRRLGSRPFSLMLGWGFLCPSLANRPAGLAGG